MYGIQTSSGHSSNSFKGQPEGQTCHSPGLFSPLLCYCMTPFLKPPPCFLSLSCLSEDFSWEFSNSLLLFPRGGLLLRWPWWDTWRRAASSGGGRLGICHFGNAVSYGDPVSVGSGTFIVLTPYCSIKMYWKEGFPLAICLLRKGRRVQLFCLPGSRELFPWKCWCASTHSNQKGCGDGVSPSLPAFSVRQRTSRNKECEREESCQLWQWQPGRWPVLPYAPRSIVLAPLPMAVMQPRSPSRCPHPQVFRPRS